MANQSYMHAHEDLKTKLADCEGKLASSDAKLSTAKAEAFKQGVCIGKSEILQQLIVIAAKTDGCEVWRALYTEILKGLGR